MSSKIEKFMKSRKERFWKQQQSSCGRTMIQVIDGVATAGGAQLLRYAAAAAAHY